MSGNRPTDAELVNELRRTLREQAAKLACEMYGNVAPADRVPSMERMNAPADRLSAEERRTYEAGEWVA